MSKKRPGVEAAFRLSQNLNVQLWVQVEAQYEDVIDSTMQELESKVTSFSHLSLLSKEQLLDLVAWKFSVGKARPALRKYLNANKDSFVQECTRDGLLLSKTAKPSKKMITESIAAITRLQGVGPATASALLCISRPEIFCYMYDEVIDVFRPKRDYTVAVYLHISEECRKIADALEWSLARVARTLWIAARVAASGKVQDLTDVGKENKKRLVSASDDKAFSRRSKRRKRIEELLD